VKASDWQGKKVGEYMLGNETLGIRARPVLVMLQPNLENVGGIIETDRDVDGVVDELGIGHEDDMVGRILK
jgi:hypothetical protein